MQLLLLWNPSFLFFTFATSTRRSAWRSPIDDTGQPNLQICRHTPWMFAMSSFIEHGVCWLMKPFILLTRVMPWSNDLVFSAHPQLIGQLMNRQHPTSQQSSWRCDLPISQLFVLASWKLRTWAMKCFPYGFQYIHADELYNPQEVSLPPVLDHRCEFSRFPNLPWSSSIRHPTSQQSLWRCASLISRGIRPFLTRSWWQLHLRRRRQCNGFRSRGLV